jgi:hypothetical protein
MPQNLLFLASRGRSFTKAERAALTLADRLKEDFEENSPELTGCYADLLSAALSEINWYEIAEHYISDCDTSEIESDEYEQATADPDTYLSDAQSHLQPFYDESSIWSLACDTLAHARAVLQEAR